MRRTGGRARREIEVVEVRRGGASTALTRDEFRARFLEQFEDHAFDPLGDALAEIERAAWDAYHTYRKSPRKRPAGDGFAEPSFELSVDWLEAHAAIRRAQRVHDGDGPTRVLVIAGASRSDQTCPGEVSKTSRLVAEATATLAELGCDVDLLDLARLASEYGKVIHPCKACVSTAMPLCHWPCSCYPNHALGQTQDWMNDIYPLWVAAHGILIVTPVYWYQAPAGLKAMMDRLVCADGGNPDPTTTRGKDPARAKALELGGWRYPRHLAGRAFGLIVHGDTTGAGQLRRSLHDWLADMDLEPAGARAMLDRYVGYYEPYATSHLDLDDDDELFDEVRNVGRTLVERCRELRRRPHRAGDDLLEPRPK